MRAKSSPPPKRKQFPADLWNGSASVASDRHNAGIATLIRRAEGA
jgi:hypothetical protein